MQRYEEDGYPFVVKSFLLHPDTRYRRIGGNISLTLSDSSSDMAVFDDTVPNRKI
jgi:hypothetical protein